MSAPVINSINFDKTVNYITGQPVIVTINYAGTNISVSAFTVTGVVTDVNSGETGTGTASFNVEIPDPINTSVSDSGKRTWTLVSDDHVGKAVYTAAA